MKKVNILINSVIRWSAYKRNDEYEAWIASCVAAGVWGEPGTYTVEVLDATEEIELKRQERESTPKTVFNSHVNDISNPHNTTKDQIGLGLVDNISAADLRSRSTHTGTQPSSTISDFTEAAQDAVGTALVDSADINFTYPDAQNQITADLTDTGVVSGTYSLVSVDAKGRVTAGTNSGSITRYSYFTSAPNATTSATYASIAQLTTVSLPTGLYFFKFAGNMQSAALNTGVGVRVAPVTATVTTVSGKWNFAQGANGVSHDFEYDQVLTTTNITSASVATQNTNFSVNGFGVFRVTVAGTVAIQTRTETAGTAATLQTDAAFVLELV